MEEVYNFIGGEINLKSDDTVVVGVSGGPDSMALLYILKELQKKIGYKIVVAHVNHNIRSESKEEALFLKDYCEQNNIVFEMMTITKYGDDNFHNEARNIRYNYYEDMYISTVIMFHVKRIEYCSEATYKISAHIYI